MAEFSDTPLVGPGSELQLTIDGRAVLHEDVVAGHQGAGIAGPVVDAIAAAVEHEPAPDVGEVGEVNLYAVGQQLAARASTPATRRQYGRIYSSFADWLSGQLGRPSTIGDVSADAVAAYGRHLEVHGGRGGGPAALSTRRVHMTMLRALAGQLGHAQVAEQVRVPTHRAGPPETITDTDYRNMLNLQDLRTLVGRRDVALLRVLGDCGLRSAEARALTAGDLRRPRSNSRHRRLYIHGKGGVEREVMLPAKTDEALSAWLAVHPLSAGGRPLRDEHPIFVRLGRHGSMTPAPMTSHAVYKVVNSTGIGAGVPGRLAHPHALRSYYATTLIESGVPLHEVAAALGHGDVRTTGRYVAIRPDRVDDLVDALDRRHQAAAR